MEKKDFLYTVILTTTVFAALITSIANIIISLINSYRLKHIEEQKKLNEIEDIEKVIKILEENYGLDLNEIKEKIQKIKKII